MHTSAKFEGRAKKGIGEVSVVVVVSSGITRGDGESLLSKLSATFSSKY